MRIEKEKWDAQVEATKKMLFTSLGNKQKTSKVPCLSNINADP